ncbi:chromate transporter [Parvibium lacunae]|uniref:Chromate transporter n=1 Tax=Parvibium lacunae TaxID=1888893 RepID=A0A368L462_9BURK|nr:chromate transporter [Parvibium lacunae]RCS58359.1 chromate transporter [Parvibium lacunae]
MQIDSNAPTAAGAPRPSSIWAVYVTFTWLALQGFGGVLAVVHRVLVEEKRWLSEQEFVEEWSVAQILPGPNVVNLALVLGRRYFGWRGAAAALAGMLSVPFCLVLILAFLYAQFAQHALVAAALRGMSAVAAGLIIATGLKLLPTLHQHPLGWRWASVLMVLAWLAVAVLRWPLFFVLLGLGSLLYIASYWRLHQQQQATRSPLTQGPQRAGGDSDSRDRNGRGQ